MVKIRVKAYISKYDLQGDEVEVDTDQIDSREGWETFKQSIVSDFIMNFSNSFKKKYKYPFEKFGVGNYKDNKTNRKLGRVGKEYDKGSALKTKLMEMVNSRQFDLQGEGNIVSEIESRGLRIAMGDVQSFVFEVPSEQMFVRRSWTEKEIDFLKKAKQEVGLSNAQIGQRVFRSPNAISKKASRLGLKAKNIKPKKVASGA